MIDVLKKIWEFLNQKNRIVILIAIILGIIIYFQYIKINNIEEKYIGEVKLKNALVDSVITYRNSENEWVTEKLTLQGTIKNVTDVNNNLNSLQKELMKRVVEIEKNSSVIAAALVETNVKIDILGKGKVEVKDSSVTFSDSTSNLVYDIEIGHVKPITLGVKPTLAFNRFEMPNKQSIEFHWKDDKKNDYPIAFSISNSNPYFKTVDVSSYAIPGLKKTELDPNIWNKFGKWTTKNGKTLLTIGGAGVGGALLFKSLSK